MLFFLTHLNKTKKNDFSSIFSLSFFIFIEIDRLANFTFCKVNITAKLNLAAGNFHQNYHRFLIFLCLFAFYLPPFLITLCTTWNDEKRKLNSKKCICKNRIVYNWIVHPAMSVDWLAKIFKCRLNKSTPESVFLRIQISFSRHEQQISENPKIYYYIYVTVATFAHIFISFHFFSFVSFFFAFFSCHQRTHSM